MHRNILLASALGAALGLTVLSPAAMAVSEDISGQIKVDASKDRSQADLARQLEASGYTDVRLSPVHPSDVDPRPDLEDTGINDTRALNSPTSRVHMGWNGTAVRDGKRVSIIVTKLRDDMED